MINNRQNGRRRGRGGQQARNGQPGVPDRGSRLDNRARGNAAQLLEKYKTLARDAQMQGDRVNTEYYLQFADHYFRVLSENRSRFEEQRPRTQEYRDDFGDDQGDGQDQAARGYDRDDGDDGDGWDEAPAAPPVQQARPRREQEERAPRREAEERPRREAGDRPQPRAEEAAPRVEGERRRTRGNAAAAAPTPVVEASAPEGVPARIEFDRLPPAISAEPAVEPANDEVPPAPKPRRRRRVTSEAAAAEA